MVVQSYITSTKDLFLLADTGEDYHVYQIDLETLKFVKKDKSIAYNYETPPIIFQYSKERVNN